MPTMLTRSISTAVLSVLAATACNARVASESSSAPTPTADAATVGPAALTRYVLDFSNTEPASGIAGTRAAGDGGRHVAFALDLTKPIVRVPESSDFFRFGDMVRVSDDIQTCGQISGDGAGSALELPVTGEAPYTKFGPLARGQPATVVQIDVDLIPPGRTTLADGATVGTICMGYRLGGVWKWALTTRWPVVFESASGIAHAHVDVSQAPIDAIKVVFDIPGAPSYLSKVTYATGQ